MRFENKIALVTGAGGDIGRAIALRLAAEGAHVVVANLSQANADETVSQIRAAGGQAVCVLGDVSQPADAERMVAAAVSEFGGLDVLVNNAGISPMGSVTETSFELWERTLRIDLTGVFLGCKYAIPAIIARGGGSIVNVAGTLGLYAMPNKSAYCAAKAGVVNLTRQMAIDYSPHGIRVNVICPGYIETRLNSGIAEDVKALFLAKLPLPFAGIPTDVADAVLFLASSEARYITGAILTVDGGQSTGLHG